MTDDEHRRRLQGYRRRWQYDTDGPAFLLERTAPTSSAGIAESTRPGTAERESSGIADDERDTQPCPPPPPASEAAAMYAETMEDLQRARQAAGGSLSEEQESAFVERLDELWWALTDDEQRQAEARK